MQVTHIHLYINLRRSRDGIRCSSTVVCLLPSLQSVRFVQMLRCAHKRVVNILKLYIEINNVDLQLELIRFRKKISTLFTFTFARQEGSRITLCLQPIR